ncbi:MAG: anion permease [Phycisphaeraceae bacterium]|nr:anion permease [Phycisphaeraceae bacterium]
MFPFVGGALFGWALGANDAANVFGTAVASNMIRYRTAVLLASLFILLGALLEGQVPAHTLGSLSEQTTRTAMITATIAALTVIVMTGLKLPVSCSQAVVGAILGTGLCVAPGAIRWEGLVRIVICWVGTPPAAALLAAGLHVAIGALLMRLKLGIVTRSIVLKSGLLIAGCYGAYALGANNVANVTGVYYQTSLLESLGPNRSMMLALMGGLSIAVGVITYSRNVMLTVGRRLVQLGAMSALVVVLAHAITMHIFTYIGVPVSSSQAVVGAVLGIGLIKSVRTINRSTLVQILLGWVMTPAIAGTASYLVAAVAT